MYLFMSSFCFLFIYFHTYWFIYLFLYYFIIYPFIYFCISVITDVFIISWNWTYLFIPLLIIHLFIDWYLSHFTYYWSYRALPSHSSLHLKYFNTNNSTYCRGWTAGFEGSTSSCFWRGNTMCEHTESSV